MVRRMIVVALTAMVCGTASAGALGPVDASADLSIMSKYVWRGVSFNDDPVFQPSMAIGFGGFNVGVWGNMNLTDVNGGTDEFDAGEFDEVDYSLDYTFDLPLVSATLGVLRYSYPTTGWEPTTEAYFGVESGLPGSPAVTIYQDIDKADGTYVEFGAGQSLPVAPFASLDVSALLGWGSEKHNRYNYGLSGMDAGFTDFSVTAALPFGIGELIAVTPSINFVSAINSDIRDNCDKYLTVFGISASAEF